MECICVGQTCQLQGLCMFLIGGQFGKLRMLREVELCVSAGREK